MGLQKVSPKKKFNKTPFSVRFITAYCNEELIPKELNNFIEILNSIVFC